MNITLDKGLFCNNILGPASKLTENLCFDVIKLDGKHLIKVLVPSADNSSILLASVPCQASEEFKCVIPDIKTFLRLFSSITDDNLSLKITSNSIEYVHKTMSFKYHLLDEAYLTAKKSISEDKLNSIQYDTEFSLSRRNFSEILKFNTIIPDAEKLYFFENEQQIYAKIGDEVKANTNELTLHVSETFSGKPLNNNFPINMQTLLLMSFSSEEILVRINHDLKVFRFDNGTLSYIVSGLVK